MKKIVTTAVIVASGLLGAGAFTGQTTTTAQDICACGHAPGWWGAQGAQQIQFGEYLRGWSSMR